MRSIASADAVGTSFVRGWAENAGKRKFMLAASFKPSAYAALVGVPMTVQIL